MMFGIDSRSQNSMKHNILLFTFVCCFLVFFSGCSQSSPEEKKGEEILETKEYNKNVSHLSSQEKNTSQNTDSELKKILEKEQKNIQKNTTSLFLDIVEEDETSVVVEVKLFNPKQEEIQSLQAWFLYPASILKGEKIDILDSSLFDLVAPAEKEFDEKNGIVKLGVSTSGKGKKTEQSLVLARVVFKKKNDSPFQFEFFETKNQVMTFTENGVRNILKK